MICIRYYNIEVYTLGRIYSVFDKFSIINIVVGFILGFYLAINHDDSNLWFVAIQFIIIFAFILTLLPTGVAIYAKHKYGENISIRALIETFFLNFAMITVCTSFGVVFGSLFIGNFIADNGTLFK